MNKLQKYELKRRVLSVFFPNVCPFCGRIINARDYYCESCVELLPLIRRELPPPENVSKLYACCWYTGVARSAVHMLKFQHLIYPADAFGLMMSHMLRRVRPDALVPAPSSGRSVEIRGFSPAEEIAKRISIRLNVPIIKAICAEYDKEEQKYLTRKSRKENAENCFFRAPGVSVRGKRLLLIDDVTTTGSTLSVLAQLLLKAGAADVSAGVFAKVPGGIAEKGRPKLYRKIISFDKTRLNYLSGYDIMKRR